MRSNKIVQRTARSRAVVDNCRWGREEMKLITIIMAAIAVIRFLTIGLAFNASHCQILWNPDQNVF
jgi:hypothetical protein